MKIMERSRNVDIAIGKWINKLKYEREKREFPMWLSKEDKACNNGNYVKASYYKAFHLLRYGSFIYNKFMTTQGGNYENCKIKR